jgi:hypothetical protein
MPIKVRPGGHGYDLHGPRVTWVLEQQQFHFRGVLGKEGEINSLWGNGSTEWLRSAWTSLPHNKMLLVLIESRLSLKALFLMRATDVCPLQSNKIRQQSGAL